MCVCLHWYFKYIICLLFKNKATCLASLISRSQRLDLQRLQSICFCKDHQQSFMFQDEADTLMARGRKIQTGCLLQKGCWNQHMKLVSFDYLFLMGFQLRGTDWL